MRSESEWGRRVSENSSSCPAIIPAKFFSTPPAFMLFSHTKMSDVERVMKKSGRSQRKIKARCDYFLRRTRKINHAILAKEHSIVRLFPSSPPPRRALCQTSGDRAGRTLDEDFGLAAAARRRTGALQTLRREISGCWKRFVSHSLHRPR